MTSLIAELKRRRVFRVGLLYLVGGWLVIEGADTLFPMLQLPEWSGRLVIGLIAIGFPLSLILAWAFDVTPEGVRRTAATTRPGPVPAGADSAGVAVLDSETVAPAARPRHEPTATPPPGTHAANTPSVAVLPFVNMSPDPDNEYFSDGITEEIINALAHVEGLRVVSRTSAFAFKGMNLDVREMGARLGVSSVVEGSVRRAGERVRVTGQLVSVEDGLHLWSETFDRDMADVFAIQDEISESIARALRVQLVGAAAAAPGRPRDLEAYHQYLRGRYWWNKRTNAAMQTAIGFFEEALRHDPGYAPAHAGIADCYTLLGWVAFGAIPPKEAFPKAEAAAKRALELDPGLSDAHNSLGWTRLVYDLDWTAAAAEFRRAIELEPRNAMAHAWYAVGLAWHADKATAIAEAERARALDPLSLIIHTLSAWVQYFARDYAESVTQCRAVLELDPNYARTYLGLGWAYEQLGRYAEAIAAFQKGAALSERSSRFVAALGHAFALAGDAEAARAVVAELDARAATGYVSPSYFAAIHAGLGDHDAAFEWLEKAHAERSGLLAFLHVDPRFDGLRGDPRYEALRRRTTH